jgi:RND family efflux transporter MFP subunit
MSIVLAGACAGVATAQPPTTDVVIATAEMRELPSTITLVGTVEPLTRSVVGSEIAGIVSEMPVRQGDRVEAGALLAKLNSDTINFELEEAKSLQRGEAARLRRWEFEVKRMSALYEGRDASPKELYDAEAERDFYKFSVERQKAIVQRLETDLDKTEIKAPFAGYIVARHTEVGEWIPKGGSVVEIVDLSEVLVRVDVPEFALPYVDEGVQATVKIDAVDEIFKGRIRHVIRQADAEARTFPVEIVVENEKGRLAAGMFARATVISGPKTKVVAVPKDALVVRQGVAYVGLVMPDPQMGTVAVLSPVTFGADVGDWIAITSDNLQPGKRVVVRGNERLFPFPAPVRIVDESGTPVEQSKEAPQTASRGRPE